MNTTLRTGATQGARIIAVGTPLGEDVLLLQRMHATERLSGLFEYTLDLLASDHDIGYKLSECIGGSVPGWYPPEGDVTQENNRLRQFLRVSSPSIYACT